MKLPAPPVGYKTSSAKEIRPAPAPSKEEAQSDDHVDDNGSSELRRPWANIAMPLLHHLLPRVSLLDRVRLSAVCRPWHDFLADHAPLRRPQFPWLVPIMIDDDPAYEIFCTSEDGHSTLLRLPAAAGKSRCVAASHGWLIFSCFFEAVQGRMGFRGFLINPLSMARIDLPLCPEYYYNVTLSAAPTDPSCMVMCLSCPPGNIYYCRIGERDWCVQQDVHFSPKSNIAVEEEKFYLLTEDGLLAEMDLRQSFALEWMKMKDDALAEKLLFRDLLLVESNGELLLVTLLDSRDRFLAYVCRADFEYKIWVTMENLHGRSLFLSKESNFSLPAVPSNATMDAGEHAGGGCIYAVGCMYEDIIHHRPWQGYNQYRLCSRELLDQWPDQWPHHESFCWHSVWFMPAF